MSTFQDMTDDQVSIELAKQREQAKNAFVLDPEAYRQKLEQLDAQYDQAASSDINVNICRIEVGQAQDKLADAQQYQTEMQQSMNPRIGWQMARRLAAADAVKQAEQTLADKEQALNTALNNFAARKHAAQLQAKRDAEQQARDAEAARRAMVAESELRDKLRGA
jgi:hypothetical protein